MSPKSCSLAIDELTSEEDYLEEKLSEPKLTVIVNIHKIENSSSDNCIQVRGRINVSF